MPRDLRSSLSSKLGSSSQHELGPELLLQNSRMDVSSTPSARYYLTSSVHLVAWSAPSAIGSAGLGVGGQLGAEMTDFLVVLNSAAAVKSFMSAGSLTLGGNMSIAVGPLGRNGEAIGSLNSKGKVAAM
jgi:hypothetical protein